MINPRQTRVALALALAGCCLVSGCIVVPARGYSTPYAGDVVMVAPPGPQTEVIGVAPGPGYFWIGGYWGWAGGRHVWQGGHWEGHRPGYQWAPHQWHRDGQGWRQAPGRWERR